MRLITGIDTAMPDVKRKWNYHAAWNQNDRLWREDFRQLADCGFDLLRWQMPWSLVQPKRGRVSLGSHRSEGRTRHAARVRNLLSGRSFQSAVLVSG